VQETAFRPIMLGPPGLRDPVCRSGVGLLNMPADGRIFFCWSAVEALNTAIECIVDHLAPQWAEFCPRRQDLGSPCNDVCSCAMAFSSERVVFRPTAP